MGREAEGKRAQERRADDDNSGSGYACERNQEREINGNFSIAIALERNDFRRIEHAATDFCCVNQDATVY